MDEKNAWKLFCDSGKIQDYINYTQIKNNAEAVNNTAPVNLRDLDASKNRGSYNS